MALSRVVQDLKVVKGFHSVVESVLKDGSIVLLTKQTEQGNACVVVPVLASCKVSPARMEQLRVAANNSLLVLAIVDFDSTIVYFSVNDELSL